MKNNNRRGMSFMLVLMVVSLLVIISFMLVVLNALNLNLVTKNRDNTKAYWAARAGISDALDRLKTNLAWNAGFANKAMPNNQGTYTITFTVGATPYSTNNTSGAIEVPGWNNTAVPAGCAHIVSTGNFGKATKISQIIVQGAFSGGLFQYPFAASGGITANRGFLSDSFDSSQGSYAATHTNSGGTIISNDTAVNTINIGGTHSQPSYVYGDLVIGPGGDPNSAISTSPNVTVTGSKYAATTSLTLPQINATHNSNDLNYSSGVNYLAGGTYGNLRVRRGAQLILTGTQYAFHSITLQNSSALIIQSASSPVTIYVDGNISASGGAIQNDTQKANYLLIYASDDCSSVSLGDDTYAGVFARNATFSPSTNTDIYGAIAVKQVNGANNLRVHFDNALKTVEVPGYPPVSVTLTIKSQW